MELTGHVTRDIHKRYTDHELAQLQKATALLPTLRTPKLRISTQVVLVGKGFGADTEDYQSRDAGLIFARIFNSIGM